MITHVTDAPNPYIINYGVYRAPFKTNRNLLVEWLVEKGLSETKAKQASEMLGITRLTELLELKDEDFLNLPQDLKKEIMDIKRGYEDFLDDYFEEKWMP